MPPFFTNGVPVASSPLTGNEVFPADRGDDSRAVGISQLGQWVLTVLDLPHGAYSEEGSTGDFTATGGQVSGAQLVVLNLIGNLAGDKTLTMPSAVLLAEQLPFALPGESYVIRFINTSVGAHKWTIAGNDTVSISGTADVSQNTWREYLVSFNSVLSNATLQNIGAGTP